MGKLVNVVRGDGKVVAIPEEDAARLEGRGDVRRETDQEAASRAVGAKNKERASGFGQGVKAFAEGAADTLTFGGYGKVAGAISPDYGEDLANRGTYRPGSRIAGEVAAMFVPVGAPALAAKAGEAVSAGLAARAINPLTRGAARAVSAAGRLTEGAILGAGGHVASTNVTGDPLTVEGTMIDMGVGGFLNVGIGALADKVANAGPKARAAIEGAGAAKADIETVRAGRELFNSPPASFETFQAAAKKASDDAGKVFKEQKRAAEQWDSFIQPKKLEGALRQAEKARDSIQAQLARSKYSQAADETRAAFEGANKQFGKLKQKADEFTGSTEDWPKTMQKVDAAIKSVRERLAPRDYETLIKPKLQGYRGFELEANGAVADRGEAVYSATKKPPIGEKTDELLKSFSERASRIRKLRQGGYRLKGKDHWTVDASVPPNPKLALEELHKLRADFSKKYGGEVFPDLPEIPRVEFPSAGPRPAEGSAGRFDELRQLSQTHQALAESISGARARFRTGDYEGVAEELRGLQSRAKAAGRHDLMLPEVPQRIEASSIEPEAVKIPKTLHELANMGEQRAQTLSNLVSADPVAAESFARLAQDLGVNGADGIAGLNAKLARYINADKRLVALARKEAEDEASGGMLAFLRRGAKKFVRYGAARAADHAAGGGWLGAGARIAAGEGSYAAMNVAEDMIGGTLMQSKLGVTRAINTLVSKFSAPTARVLKELGPVTAYLQTNFVNGEKDDEKDTQELARRRIADSVRLSTTAPDASFIAVQSLLGHDSDIAAKLSQKAVGDINHLVETAPKDPGLAFHALRSQWKPTYEDALTYAYRIEAVVDPLKAIARTIAGDGHPAAIETLWARWPALMQCAADEFVWACNDMKNPSYATTGNYSQLFRTPISGVFDPEVAAAIQGAYMPKPQQSTPESSGAGNTGNPVGRPAAVQSSVAGSSVSGLISQ